MTSEEFDVVIVGAGLSGLTAAYTISKENPSTSLLILEATDHIGGPIKTVKMRGANGDDFWDIGASRIGSKHKELMELLKEFELETYEHFDKGKKFWQLPDGNIKSYSGKIPPLPYTSLVDILRYFNKVDGMQKKVNLADVKSTPKAEEWDDMTVDELKTKTLWTQAAKQMVDVLTVLFFGIPPPYISVMQYAHTVASCGSWDAHIAGEGTGNLDIRIKGGTRNLIDRLVNKIGNEKIVLNTKVMNINQNNEENCVELETESGKLYRGKKIIMAIPLFCNAKIKFTPPLSSSHLLPSPVSGQFFVVTYKKSFWREAGSCADILSMVSALEAVEDNADHPVLLLYDHTSASGNPAVMGAFGAVSLRQRTAEERKHMVITFLKEVFKSDEPQDVLDYQEFEWMPCEEIPPETAFKEEKASYTLSSIRKPEGRIHWAGAHTATAWIDSLNGAVQAGQRAGREVVQ